MIVRILIVDDEPDLEALVMQRFRHQIREGSLGFLFAGDGVDALELIAGDVEIDMVLTDINMPRMDGLSLLARLQEADEHLSTIIVSAYGDMANIRTAMDRGAFDFLTKPIDFSDLEATISKTIRHLELQREARRRQLSAERAHESLSRYFSPNLAERIANDTEGVDLAGRRREITSLFTDIASFTSLAESIDPGVLSNLLNGYVVGMTDIVFGHEGTVTKIVGDALHVLFGAPGDQDDHAAHAVACALDLDDFSQSYRERWLREGIVLGATRIGVHCGPAVVGNFGGSHFFDYTAYGDTINTAARLEAANKQLGTRICVSESVVRQVAGFRGRPVGDLILRGKSQALRAFEPLRPPQCDDPNYGGYLEAFAKLEARDAGALGTFAAQLGRQPDDPLSSFHLKRLLNGASGSQVVLD